MRCTECSREVLPVVAVDIDGTLGDYHGHFVQFAGWYLGRSLPATYDGAGPFNEALKLDKASYRQVKLAYRQGGMKRSMPLYPNAAGFMKRLAGLPCEIWITTTRPYLRLDNIDPDTREWMRRHGIHADGMLYDEDKYQQLVNLVDPERIVAVIDDQKDQCDDADRLGLNAWQPERSHNRAVRTEQTFRLFGDMLEVLEGLIDGWGKEPA